MYELKCNLTHATQVVYSTLFYAKYICQRVTQLLSWNKAILSIDFNQLLTRERERERENTTTTSHQVVPRTTWWDMKANYAPKSEKLAKNYHRHWSTTTQ